MAVTPAIGTPSERQKAWAFILKSMGYRDLNQLINSIYISEGTPATELSDMDDYCFVWDKTNNIAYVHTTGTTFTAIGQAINFVGGMSNQANTLPNAEG